MFARLIPVMLIIASTAIAQQPAADLSAVMELVAKRDHAAAIAELRSMEENDPESFARTDRDYLLARLAQRAGDTVTAFAAYQTVAGRDSVLAGYALWHLSTLARFSGNPFLERLYLKELMLRKPGSLLTAAAVNRIARSHFAAGDHALAAGYFQELIAGSGTRRESSMTDRLGRENLSLLAESYRRMGDTTRARELYTRLLNESPDPRQPDDTALVGARGLDLLDSTDPATIAPEQLQQRAWAYQFNREFENARRLYLTIVNTDVSGRYAADAAFQIGRGYTQTNDFAEAAQWYERVLEQYPDTPIARDAWLQAASAYGRLGKFREAAVRYNAFIDRFPNEERLDRAYLNLIDIARDQGEEVEALRRAKTAQELFRGKLGEAQALFAEARIYLAREEWPTAADALARLEILPDLGGARVPGGTSVPEVRYLRAVAAEGHARFDEAVGLYLSVADGRAEFYGMLATRRLQEMAAGEATRQLIATRLAEVMQAAAADEPNIRRRELQNALRLETDPGKRETLLDALRAVYVRIPAYTGFDHGLKTAVGSSATPRSKANEGTSDRHQPIADRLMELGLYDEAAAEAEAAGSITDLDRLAALYLKGDRAERAVRIGESTIKIPADYQIELMPRGAIEVLYPAPYAAEMVSHSVARGIDPRLLPAIIRQETRFRPTVRSDAAARGLMQFISTTSLRIANELSLPGFSQEDLYDPTVAIMFGSEYVSELFMLYPGQPEAVAASYNGGEDNMKRWMGRARSSSAGRYVPEIMYSQTKDYVYKVMTNYRVYRAHYDENLFLRTP
jgi:soluble lytic murein transglycosylase-like protein